MMTSLPRGLLQKPLIEMLSIFNQTCCQIQKCREKMKVRITDYGHRKRQFNNRFNCKASLGREINHPAAGLSRFRTMQQNP